MLTAVTITPVLCYSLLPGLADRPALAADNRVLGFAKRLNRRVVDWALDNGRLAVLGIAGVALAAVVVVATVPRVFLPPFNERPMVVLGESRPGISLVEASRIARVAEYLLLDMPEVRLVGRRTGRAEFDEHVEGVNFSDIYVDFADTGLILRGCDERVAPVAMTVLSTGLALVPLLIDSETPGKEVLHPVAVTIFGGLVSALIMDTVLTPVLFQRFGRNRAEALMKDRVATAGPTAVAEVVY